MSRLERVLGEGEGSVPHKYEAAVPGAGVGPGPSLPGDWEWPDCEEAAAVARCTEQLLATQGWCLWQCQALGGEVIVIAGDQGIEGMPQCYVVYTDGDLRELFGEGRSVDTATLRLVHEARKHGAAVAGREIQPQGPDLAQETPSSASNQPAAAPGIAPCRNEG